MKIVQVAGYSGTGKTSLCRYLIGRFRREGLKVGAVKHAHNGFQINGQGKDSWMMARAGASLVSVVHGHRAFVVSRHARGHSSLESIITLYQALGIEAVVVEGFKSEPLEESVLLVTAHSPKDLARVAKAARTVPVAVATLGRKSDFKDASVAPVYSLKTEKGEIYRIITST